MEKVEVDPILTERDWQDLIVLAGTLSKIQVAIKNGTVTQDENDFVVLLLMMMHEIGSTAEKATFK